MKKFKFQLGPLAVGILRFEFLKSRILSESMIRRSIFSQTLFGQIFCVPTWNTETTFLKIRVGSAHADPGRPLDASMDAKRVILGYMDHLFILSDIWHFVTLMIKLINSESQKTFDQNPRKVKLVKNCSGNCSHLHLNE